LILQNFFFLEAAQHVWNNNFSQPPLEIIQMCNMKTLNQPTSQHALVFMVKSFIQKLVQHPEIYPIRFYKKSERLKKNRRGMMG